jgi:transposase
MARPSKYPPEFRARGVQLYRDSEGRTIAEVARELGVGAETFRKWVPQGRGGPGSGSGEADLGAVGGVVAAQAQNAELRATKKTRKGKTARAIRAKSQWSQNITQSMPTTVSVSMTTLRGVQGGESLDCRTSEMMVLRIMPTRWLS